MFFKKNLLKKKIDQFLLQFFYYKKIILKLFEVYPNFWILINTVNFSICLFDPPTAIHHYKKELRPLPFLVLVSLPFQSRERERDRERERESLRWRKLSTGNVFCWNTFDLPLLLLLFTAPILLLLQSRYCFSFSLFVSDPLLSR